MSHDPSPPPTADTDSPSCVKGRFPSWLHRTLPPGKTPLKTRSLLDKYRLHTVCEEGRCPNRFECFAHKTATFLALGKECTRRCGFCSVAFSKTPCPPEEDEPLRIALSVKELELKHVVLTMVTRDDLVDGGAHHIARILQVIRQENPSVSLEVLTSDFQGSLEHVNIVLQEKPDIFNHNIETVRELTPRVRNKATYERSLQVLQWAKQSRHVSFVKSGLMVGLGETETQVHEALSDLHRAGCTIITIGQYLQPHPRALPVKQFISPHQFELYREKGLSLGIPHMICGPFVRSSYHAHLPGSSPSVL